MSSGETKKTLFSSLEIFGEYYLTPKSICLINTSNYCQMSTIHHSWMNHSLLRLNQPNWWHRRPSKRFEPRTDLIVDHFLFFFFPESQSLRFWTTRRSSTSCSPCWPRPTPSRLLGSTWPTPTSASMKRSTRATTVSCQRYRREWNFPSNNVLI